MSRHRQSIRGQDGEPVYLHDVCSPEDVLESRDVSVRCYGSREIYTSVIVNPEGTEPYRFKDVLKRCPGCRDCARVIEMVPAGVRARYRDAA